MAERYIIIVVVPLLTSVQPSLSVIVALTFTDVVAFGVSTIELPLFNETLETVGAVFGGVNFPIITSRYTGVELTEETVYVTT